jgi:spermidine synthase
MLHVAFFLSGAAALVFENLWFRQAGLAFGNSVWASSLVLASFMAGLALGNALAARRAASYHSPVRVYALVEIVVAGVGLGLVLLLSLLNVPLATLLAALSAHPGLRDALRLGAAFSLLVVPTTGMGMTLPLLAQALRRWRPEFGRNLGSLYGWNTLGAVAGTLGVETLLLGPFGIRGAAVAAALLGLLAAAAALVVSRHAGEGRTDTPPVGAAFQPRARISATAVRLVTAAALAGGTLLALEVVWFRFLALFTPNTRLSFAIMLGAVLAGIGLGGLVASAWLSRDGRAVSHLRSTALLGGLTVVATYSAFADLLPSPAEGGVTGPHTALLAAALVLPVSLVSGVLFTLTGVALREHVESDAASAGMLTLGNTIGGMLGALLGGFLLLPRLGTELSIALLAAAYGLVALCLPGTTRGHRTARQGSWVAAAAWAAFVAFFPFGLMERRYLPSSWDEFAGESVAVLAVREGLTETAAYLEHRIQGEPVSRRLVTNGFSMSGTGHRARRYMRLFVHLPVALHPGMESALLISYGVGVTADALVKTRELRRIEVVDVSRDILELSRELDPDRCPLEDPRVALHVEDGRHFLQTVPRRFDLITGEPPPPKNAGIVSLYTREYFALVRDRLTEGGFASYWLPVHSLTVDESRAVVRGFCEVFSDCSLWNGAHMDWILLGSRPELRSVSEARFARQWHDPVVRADLLDIGLDYPEQAAALFLADAEGLDRFVGETPPLVDNWPHRLDPSAPIDWRPYRALVEAAGVESFTASARVRELWPPELRERSVPWFRWQRALDRHFWGARDADVPALFADLHELLSLTDLRMLSVLVLGSDPDRQHAAVRLAARGGRGPWVSAELAVEAMSRRDYEEAASSAAEAMAADPSLEWMRFIRIYALAALGDVSAARQGLDAWGERAPPAARRLLSALLAGGGSVTES